MMHSEVDPLLPKNEPSPELSGYGYSTTKRYQPEIFEDREDEEQAEEAPLNDPTSPQATIASFVGMFAILVAFAFLVTTLLGSSTPEPIPHPKPHRPGLSGRVETILHETPLIDGHNDLAIFIRFMYQNHIHDEPFKHKFEDGGLEFHVDLSRLKTGMVGGALWSAYVGCPANGTDFSDESYANAVSTTLSQIDLVRRLQSTYSHVFSPSSLNSHSAFAAFQSNHSLVSPISIEGLHQVPQSNPLSTLRLYHALGVRAATLTHNCVNAFADPALVSSSKGGIVPASPYWNGLSPAGYKVIKEMNRLGMLVDISHTSHDTQLDVLGKNGSKAPVIYSHSSAFELCEHPRNVRDEALKLVKKTNSLVMVNFSPDFISCLASPTPSETLPEFYPDNSTLHQVARHITYIGEKIGYDHVGLGSDFDGIMETPRGLDDVSKFPDLIAELLRMGVSDVDASKVVGGNLLRVWGAAEKVAKEMEREVEGEDDVSKKFVERLDQM